MKRSPLYIHTLLEAYVGSPFTAPESKVLSETINEMIEDDLITFCEESTSGYRATRLGEAYVRAILKTEVPSIAYVDSNGNIV